MAKAHDNAYFTPDLFEFLRQLRRHDGREWCARNKARYQQFVVENRAGIINGFAPFFAELSSHFVADPPPPAARYSASIATPASHRTTPFKTHAGIHFSHAAARTLMLRVFYLHLEPDGCFAAAGVWHPDIRS